jgi:hypothetical protein
VFTHSPVATTRRLIKCHARTPQSHCGCCVYSLPMAMIDCGVMDAPSPAPTFGHRVVRNIRRQTTASLAKAVGLLPHNLGVRFELNCSPSKSQLTLFSAALRTFSRCAGQGFSDGWVTRCMRSTRICQSCRTRPLRSRCIFLLRPSRLFPRVFVRRDKLSARAIGCKITMSKAKPKPND